MATLLLHRKHLRPPSYARLDSKPRHRQPVTPTRIGVLHLPHSKGAEHPTSLIQVPLIKIGSEDISEAECTDYEKQLGYIPDLRGYDFSWNHRKLLDVSEKPEYAEPQGAVCKMYVCFDKKSGLPHNLALEDIVVLPEVFGDAFIFKMNPQPTGSGQAHYLHKDEDFVLTGGESMVCREAILGLYRGLKKEDRLEAEGITTQVYGAIAW